MGEKTASAAASQELEAALHDCQGDLERVYQVVQNAISAMQWKGGSAKAYVDGIQEWGQALQGVRRDFNELTQTVGTLSRTNQATDDDALSEANAFRVSVAEVPSWAGRVTS